MDDTTSEIELLQGSAAGDKEAFGAVVRRYQTLVCAVTYSITGDVGTSEELAQETFLRAWQNIGQLEDPGRFRVWLCTIARNLSATWLRARRRRSVRPLDQTTDLPATGPRPDEETLAKERQEIVWTAVECIPPQYREPLVLFYRSQHSVSEVATDLDLSEEIVRQRLHRGRQLIKAEVSSLVEETLARSGPGKAFAVGIVAALPAILTPPASAAVVGLTAKGAPVAKLAWATGLTGVILGPIVGVLGGLFGAWCSIRNTKSPRERRFMIQVTILVWTLMVALIGVPLVLALTGLVSKAVYWSCYAAFFAGLLPLILWINRRHRRIRMEDGTYREPDEVVSFSTAGIYGSFAGSIFGASAWLLIMAALAGHWVSFVQILACDVSMFCGAAIFCTRQPERYWFAAILAVFGVMSMTLIAVNLCWVAWMTAYRRSWAYDAGSDMSVRTINLIVVGVAIAVIALLATRHFLAEKARRNRGKQDRST
jgi:RNA polymerase sigma factor (sigma-70 family)